MQRIPTKPRRPAKPIEESRTSFDALAIVFGAMNDAPESDREVETRKRA